MFNKNIYRLNQTKHKFLNKINLKFLKININIFYKSFLFIIKHNNILNFIGFLNPKLD